MASKSLFKLEINPTFRDFKGRFAKADVNLLENRRNQVRVLGRLFVDLAEDEAPKDTGEFAKGIRWRSFRKGTQSIGFTASDPQPLGKWIRGGTKPHTIQPKGPGYPLRWEKGGQVFFAMKVFHPGTKPNPYDERALERWQPIADVTNAKISTRYVQTIAHGRTI